MRSAGTSACRTSMPPLGSRSCPGSAILRSTSVNWRDATADAFAGIDGVTFVAEPSGTRATTGSARYASRNHLAPDEILLIEAAVGAGIQVRPFWNLLSEQRMYASDQAGPLDEHEHWSTPSSPCPVPLGGWRE